jgi:hypothetical protein
MILIHLNQNLGIKKKKKALLGLLCNGIRITSSMIHALG